MEEQWLQQQPEAAVQKMKAKTTKASRGHDIANKKDTSNARIETFTLKQFAGIKAKLVIPQNFRPTRSSLGPKVEA